MAQVITIAGEKLFATKAQANQQLDIDTFIFANVAGQDPAAEIDRNEGIPTAAIVHQQNVQQTGRINDNVVVYSTVLDSVTGPFEFNWVGLYSSVNQTLVAISHVPTVAKTITAPGSAGNTLNRNFGIEYSGIADLAGINVAPETWQLDFSARLSGMDELTRQLASDMNGKDWFIDDGFKVVPRSTANTFSVTPGVGYVSGLRVELKQEHILTLQTYPQFVYVDAYFDGDASSQWKPQVAFTVSNTEMDDYIDVNGVQHYVYKLASIGVSDTAKDLRSNNGLAENLKEVQNYIDNLNKGLIATEQGRIGVDIESPQAKVHVSVDNDVTAGIRSTCNWEGTTEVPFQNHDCSLFEVFNDVKSSSFNQSWGVSSANAYNNIPAGVVDSGQRVGVYGWAVSTPVAGYKHRGSLEFQFGLMGRAGFLGAGTPVGAVINNAIGVRGEIVNDSVGADIYMARAGEFLSTASTGNVNYNYGVYALAMNGNVNTAVLANASGGVVNYSIYSDYGQMFHKHKANFGNESGQSDAIIGARVPANAFEFGNPDPNGYGSNIGSTAAAAYPFVVFCAEAEEAGNTYKTRGKKGVVIFTDLLGSLIFARLPISSAPEQEPVESGRFTDEGILMLGNVPVHADNAAAVSSGLSVGAIYKTASGELRIVI
ncbi:phage tail protein [Pseudoalteromonas sp.]|uniref:phage tail-collar fiber domain-containing protein n=1 Tax=Pseudoalteromonas sp. TaxID=53249 RepID=UPI003561381D